MAQSAQRVPRERLVRREPMGLQVLLEQLVPRVQQEPMELQVPQELMAQ